MKRTFTITSILLAMTALLFAGQINPAPPLNSTMNADNTLSAPAPQGWQVTEVERTQNGIRFYRIVDGKRIEWADYKTPLTVQVDLGPIPPPPPNPIPSISSPLEAPGIVGKVFSYIITATHSPTVYGALNLPSGVLLNPQNGLLSGIPTVEGVSQVKISATNANGTGEALLVITVTGTVPPLPPPPPPPGPTKLRVILSYDPTVLDKMPEAQRQVLSSEQAGHFRDYCRSHSVQDETIPAFRVWPIVLTVNDVPDVWKPLVTKMAGKVGLFVQDEIGKITRFDFPTDNADAVKKLKSIAEPEIQLEPTVTDANYKKFINVPGKSTGFIQGVVPAGLQSFHNTYPLIPRSQWKQLVQEGKGTFLSDLIKAAKIKVKDQDGLGYCWVYASVSTVETIRALQGQPYIELSPESVGGPVTGWRNQGGWGFDALKQLEDTGACLSSFMDRANSLSPRSWKTGWEADCTNHKITAAWASIDDGNFDSVFTAALLRLPVSEGLDWWRHQIQVCDPVVFSNGSYGVLIRNSWGDMADWPDGWGTLTESKSQPSGSYACISVGTSDKDLNDRARGTPVDLVRRRAGTIKKAIQQYQNAP